MCGRYALGIVSSVLESMYFKALLIRQSALRLSVTNYSSVTCQSRMLQKTTM